MVQIATHRGSVDVFAGDSAFLQKLERVSKTRHVRLRPLLPFARPEERKTQVILDRFRLDDQVAVVTGAGRGLGAAMALAFAEAGADVLIAARTQSQLEEVAEQIKSTGRRAEIVVADLAHPEDTAKLAGKAIEAFGKLDIVVNNVGGTMPNTLLTTSTKDLRDAFTFNVATAHALTTAAVPLMLEHSGGGSIINVTSTMGRLAGRGFAAYGTAKAALAHYTRLAALDLCPRIRVNAIAPGSILTSALDIVASNDELRTPMEKVTPMRRLGDPEDIAAAAVYLASPAGSFLTGKTLEVDGGLTFPNLDLPVPDL
jgi:7-alpha-hydroxysteroid dehydrogenase